jgi:hypothetical protein
MQAVTKVKGISLGEAELFLYAPSELEEEFQSHAQKWKRETFYMSSLDDMCVHPSYQRIIGMGRQAVPLVLRELEKEPDHWFWALTAITGQDPAQGEDSVEGAAKAWLKWGREQGYID